MIQELRDRVVNICVCRISLFCKKQAHGQSAENELDGRRERGRTRENHCS